MVLKRIQWTELLWYLKVAQNFTRTNLLTAVKMMHKEISLGSGCSSEKHCCSHRYCFAKGITGHPEPFIFSLEKAQSEGVAKSGDTLRLYIPVSACLNIGPLTSPTNVHVSPQKYEESNCCNIVPFPSMRSSFYVSSC